MTCFRAYLSIFAVLATAAALACDPGVTTVHAEDTGSTSPRPDTSNAQPDAHDPQPTPDAGPTPDASPEPPDATDPPDVPPPPPQPSRLWTGETDGTIAWWTLDPIDGTLTRDGAIERSAGLNFLAASADDERLYAAIGGRVEAFDITTLPPTFLGSANAGLSDTATHLAVDATRSHIFVAWYGGDAITMLPLDADGQPSDATVVIGGAQSPSYCRRAHQVRVHPNNDFVYVPCLQSDHVAVLAYDPTAGTLTPASTAPTPSGTGPRHLAFHPTLDQAYVIGELNDTIVRYAVDPSTGALTQLDVVSTRPSPGDTLGPASDIHVSPDGRHVVGINRNPRDEVVVFNLAADGTPSQPTWTPTGGTHARTFAFSPDGGYLIVGNSNSEDMTLFRFDDGAPTQLDLFDTFDARLFYVGFR